MERTITKRVVHNGRDFSFRSDVVKLSDGRGAFRDIVDHLGSVAIILILPNGGLSLMYQYRYAVVKHILELPAGTLDDSEKPGEFARRELKEEIGNEASEIRELLRCFPLGTAANVSTFSSLRTLRRLAHGWKKTGIFLS